MTAPPRRLGYTCNLCNNTSGMDDDVQDLYCGHCHLQNTGDLVVISWDDPWDPDHYPVLKPPRPGCAVISHERLGWCAHCPNISGTTEAMAWRLHAMGEVVPGHTGAVRMSKAVRR